MTEAPKRIQLSRQKGWRLPANAVKVDRTTVFGNPYRIGEPMDMKQVRRWGWEISPEGRKFVCDDAATAVRRFAHCLFWDSAIHGFVREKLKGKDLACWCAVGSPCHADTLLVLANSDPACIREMQGLMDDRIIADAQKVLSTESDEHCEDCTHCRGPLFLVCFNPEGEFSNSPVHPQGWCDRFKRRKQSQ